MITFAVNTNQTCPNAVDTDPSLPSDSTILRSRDICMGGRTRRGGASITVKVTEAYENRGQMSGDRVSAVWTLLDGSRQEEVAISTGCEAKFCLSGPHGTYRIDVLYIPCESYTIYPEYILLN